MSLQTGWPGAVGFSVSPGPLTRSRSRFGPPLAVVPVALIVLAPAFSVALRLISCQVVHAPVPGKDWPAAMDVPLTVTLIGRSTVVPLAKRNVRVCGPAVAALTA